MDEEDYNEPPNQIAFINRDEAWNIISNQIEVQEQLRTRGYQVLSILSAIAVLVAGISLSIDFSISESELEAVLASTSFSESDLELILGLHQIAAGCLFLLSLLLISYFIIGNYRVSRHSSLEPGLGEKENFSIAIVTNNNHQNILNENRLMAHQYEGWIASNAETLNEKRTKLNMANLNLTYALFCLLLSILLLFYSSVVNLGQIFFIDIVILGIFSFAAFYLLKTRDEWLNWRSWPITEQQKEDFPYLNTSEFSYICLFSVIILPSILIGWFLLAISLLG